MLLDLGLTSETPASEFIKMFKLAEKGGFNCLWIGEDLEKPYDIFVQASIALLRTSLKVGTGITSIYFRNITNIARAAAGLHEIGRNRFRLGIGVGGIQALKKLGISPRKPLSAMREATFLLRKIWNGETITFKSEKFQLKNYYPRFGLKQKIPIFFGVRGLKMLELAGEIADGVILSGPKTYLQKAIEIVKTNARKAGRTENDVNLIVWIPTILISKREELEFAREVVTVVLADTPRNVLNMSKIDVEAVMEIKNTLKRGLNIAARLVTEEMLNDVVFYGDPQELCSSMRSLEKYGINEIVFGPPFGINKENAISKIARTWRRN
jgi:5,10-methylenetetrahydromethanopterin reductase